MVEISSPGSGEGRGWVTGPGYSTELAWGGRASPKPSIEPEAQSRVITASPTPTETSM